MNLGSLSVPVGLAALSLAAGGMTASAHPDDDYLEAPSETSPIGPATVLDAYHASSALKLTPADIANALHVTLPEVKAPQHAAAR